MRFIKSKVSSILDLFALNKTLKNIGWLFIDKIVRMGVGLLVGIKIARYLGPSQFGQWNYAIALTSLLSVLSSMGLDSFIVRDIINDADNTPKILGTSLFIRSLGSILIVIISCAVVFLTTPSDLRLLLIVFLTSFSYVFLSFDVIDFFFQSKLQSKYTVIAKFIAFMIFSVLRVIGIIINISLLLFVVLALGEVLIGACFMLFIFIKRSNFSPLKWRINFSYLKKQIGEGWPLILSSMVVMVYMRIDQVMLEYMSGPKTLGIYSAAVRISEIWYLIPTIISTSFYPGLLKLKVSDPVKYKKRFENLFSILFMISLSISLLMLISSSTIIHILYGPAFQESSAVLNINIWAGVFVFLGVATSNYMVIEKLSKIAFYNTLLGAVCNVILNIILIPKYGGVGSATATLISYGLSAYFSNLIFYKTRPLFFIINKAIFNSFKLTSYKFL